MQTCRTVMCTFRMTALSLSSRSRNNNHHIAQLSKMDLMKANNIEEELHNKLIRLSQIKTGCTTPKRLKRKKRN